MDELQSIFVGNMREARKKLGYSQLKFAELCDLSQSYIAEIERGNRFPSTVNILRISGALGMKPYQLFMPKEEAEGFDQYDVLTRLIGSLKKRINDDIEGTIKEFLSQ